MKRSDWFGPICGEVACAHADAALRKAELRHAVRERREREIGAVAQAHSQTRGLQLGERVVVHVDAVAGGERVVQLGLREGVHAGGFERDIALGEGDARDAAGRILRRAGVVRVLRVRSCRESDSDGEVFDNRDVQVILPLVRFLPDRRVSGSEYALTSGNTKSGHMASPLQYILGTEAAAAAYLDGDGCRRIRRAT